MEKTAPPPAPAADPAPQVTRETNPARRAQLLGQERTIHTPHNLDQVYGRGNKWEFPLPG